MMTLVANGNEASPKSNKLKIKLVGIDLHH